MGNLAISLALPIIGIFLDNYSSGASTLRYIAVMPAILIIAFLFLNTYMKKSKA